MARELARLELNERTYECLQFDVKKSLRILSKIGRRVGKPIALMVESYDPKSGGLLEQDFSKLNIGVAVEEMLKDLGDDEAYELAKEICSSVIAQSTHEVGGALSQNFDEHFRSAGLKQLFHVCKWALEVNYGNFLGAAAEFGGQRKAVQSEKSSTRVR